MTDKLVLFTIGLNKDEILKCVNSFEDGSSQKLEICPVTQNLLDKKLESVINDIDNACSKKNAQMVKSRYRTVLINSQSKDTVLRVLRKFKKVLLDPHSIIFAMITDNARQWTFA
jgi:hypothetical protein